MYKKLIIGLIAVAGILQTPLHAQNLSKVGTTAGKFLAIPAGARGIGVGGAFTALVDDPTAMYWNPAGITKIKSLELAIDHTTWFEGVHYEFLGIVYPAGRFGTIGLNILGFGTGDMEVTTEYEQEGTGEYFSAGSYAFGLSYARQLTDNFAIGANGKYIREQIWHSVADGLALDMGVTYHTPWEAIDLGFSISNFGQKLQMTGEDLYVTVDPYQQHSGNNENLTGVMLTDEFDLPLLLRLGVAAHLIETSALDMTLLVDALHPNDNTESVNVGGELALLDNKIFVRGGFRALGKRDRQAQYAIGGGFYYPILGNMNLKLDYVYESHQYLGFIQKYSLGLAL